MGQIDIWTDEQGYIQTGGQTGGQTEGQMDKHIAINTEKDAD